MKEPLAWAPDREEAGTVIACDSRQEWLLPWWYENYRKHCTEPVTLVDLGMTGKARKEAPAEINRVKLQDPPSGWWGKPLAIIQSPYRSTLYLDMDCEVLGPIQDLFEARYQPYIRLRVDEPYKRSQWADRLYAGEIMYNSGVIAVSHGNSLIIRWAKACLFSAQWFHGDQEVLARLIHLDAGRYAPQLEVLPSKYNKLRGEPGLENEIIRHHTGPLGKDAIRQQLNVE